MGCMHYTKRAYLLCVPNSPFCMPKYPCAGQIHWRTRRSVAGPANTVRVISTAKRKNQVDGSDMLQAARPIMVVKEPDFLQRRVSYATQSYFFSCDLSSCEACSIALRVAGTWLITLSKPKSWIMPL